MGTLALAMFDYDGVIVDSLDMFTSAFISACRENGFSEVNSREDIMALFENNVYEAMKNRGLDSQTIDKILRAYATRASERHDELKLFDGMGEALRRISGKNKIFIITSNVSGAPVRVLKRYGISCFEDVIGADKEKSKVKKIRKLMDQYPSLRPYYVGDTTGDIIEGKKAGSLTIGVAWGWHGPRKLKESSPDYLVYSPEELAGILCGQ